MFSSLPTLFLNPKMKYNVCCVQKVVAWTPQHMEWITAGK